MVLKNVAVTGALGMLGRHIVSQLKFSNFNVVSISKSFDDTDGCKNWDLMHWNSNKQFDSLLLSVDVVVHCGAAVPSANRRYSDSELFYANVGATLNLARWCRKRNIPFIYISGAIVYKNPDSRHIKESSIRGYNDIGGFYGETKLISEDLLYRENNEGLRLSIIRPSSIYGCGLSKEKLISLFLDKAINNNLIQIKEPINDCVDLIHAFDVSSAIVSIINKNEWDTFNISSGKCVSIVGIAETCISIVGSGKIEILGDKTDNFRKRYVLDNSYSIKKLDWSPCISLHDGISSVFEEKIIYYNGGGVH